VEAQEPFAFLVTCEHGGNEVPAAYRPLFRDAGRLLASHRGWDPGALALARRLARRLDAPLHGATVTRLLVDLNRSVHHPKVFSEVTRGLDRETRRLLLDRWHTPHRERVAADVAAILATGAKVLHLGVHSFTPVLDGVVRRPDLSILYDPARAAERELGICWAGELKARLPDLTIRRNDPYRGAADGLTTWLRRRYPGGRYLGFEIEVNQRLLDRRGHFPPRIGAQLSEVLGLGAKAHPR
jgi:predicted N-formylglutamate amidohydrolase